MKKSFMIMAIAALAFASCTKDVLNTKGEQAGNEAASYTLTAIAPGNDESKTSLQKGEGNSWNVLWSENDALRVKVSGDGTSSSHYAEYTLESGEGTGNAVFRGTVEAPDEVFAFYPSSKVTTINPTYGMYFDIPSKQTCSATGIVPTNSLPMYANGSKSSLQFQHICSIIRIPVWTEQSGVRLNSVSIVSSEGRIAGSWFFRNGNPAPTSNVSSEITINCGNVLISQSESSPNIIDAILGVSSGTFGNLSIYFNFDNGTSIEKSIPSWAVNRGKIYKCPVLKLVPIAGDLQIRIDEGEWMNWDGVSDIATPTTSVAVRGTDSKLLLSSLKLILDKVQEGESKISLDFSAVTACDFSTITSDTGFRYHEKIKDVKLPEGIKTINDMGFRSSSVECLTLPQSISSVGVYIFLNAKSAYFAVNSLNPIYCAIDGHLYRKNGTSSETYSLSQIAFKEEGPYTIADNTTVLESSALRYCQKLTSVTIPATVTKIENNSTLGATKLANITLLGEVPPTLGLSGGKHWQDENYCAGYGVTGPKTIKVPAGCLEAYTGTEGNRTEWWRQFHDIAGYEFVTE